MTREQLIEEIRRLPLEQKLKLLETISRSVREDLDSKQERNPDAASKPKQINEGSGENRVPVSHRLYGILKFDGEPPTDEKLKDAYADYLLEKYS
ncbi:MAG TPA: hypothetical protein VK619_07535 [Pyrinomonadaceae bacterium]|nr:hypothetical protein [Pyrinomonadaceae bacterium]